MESELRKAAQAFVDKLTLVEPAIRAAFACLWVHAMPYDGPNYGGELAALKAALATPPVPTDTVRLAPEQGEHKCHLVRGKKTLCGLDEWGGGNVDFKFGVERGITSCVRCLRVLALEGLKAKTQPDAAVEAALDVFEAQAYNRKDVVRFAEKIVAAVRKADAEKAGVHD